MSTGKCGFCGSKNRPLSTFGGLFFCGVSCYELYSDGSNNTAL
jgi:hypothetical protein